MSDQAVTVHPAVPVLAAHEVARWTRGGTLAHCTCGTAIPCTDAGDEYAAHLTEMLDRAGFLKPVDPPPTLATCRHCDATIRESPGAFGSTWWRTEDGGLICGGGSGDAHEPAGLAADGTSPETPTTRVLAERADRRTT